MFYLKRSIKEVVQERHHEKLGQKLVRSSDGTGLNLLAMAFNLPTMASPYKQWPPHPVSGLSPSLPSQVEVQLRPLSREESLRRSASAVSFFKAKRQCHRAARVRLKPIHPGADKHTPDSIRLITDVPI